jgi:hypothetical protein
MSQGRRIRARRSPFNRSWLDADKYVRLFYLLRGFEFDRESQINKFYIMDLAPKRSLTEYAVAHGVQFFSGEPSVRTDARWMMESRANLSPARSAARWFMPWSGL